MSSIHQNPADSREVWLRPNRRALGLFVLATSFMLAGSIFVLCMAPGQVVLVTVSLAAILLSALLVVFLVAFCRPRLAFQAGELLVYLRPGPPSRVPIEVVECFFLGQGDSLLGRAPLGRAPLGRAPHEDESTVTQTSTVVVRLAEAATQWKHQAVQPALGQWCDGYIIIRGTWCEPISAELLKQLNHRLVQAHRARRELVTQESP